MTNKPVGTNGSTLMSKSQLDKASKRVRKFMRGEVAGTEINEALPLIVAYRQQFIAPVGRVNADLSRLRNRLGVAGRITSRPKTVGTIVEKLSRGEGTSLSRMEDIGGCRLVVESIHDLRRIIEATENGVADHVVRRDRDYLDKPRQSGYTAFHRTVVECTSGLPIEIQLRTQRMHDWAEHVERLSRALRVNYKIDGTHPVQEFMKTQSYWVRHKELEETLPAEYSATLAKQIKIVNSLLDAEFEEDEEDTATKQ